MKSWGWGATRLNPHSCGRPSIRSVDLKRTESVFPRWFNANRIMERYSERRGCRANYALGSQPRSIDEYHHRALRLMNTSRGGEFVWACIRSQLSLSVSLTLSCSRARDVAKQNGLYPRSGKYVFCGFCAQETIPNQPGGGDLTGPLSVYLSSLLWVQTA